MIENRDIYPPLSFEFVRADPEAHKLLTKLDEQFLYHTYRLEPSRHTLRVISGVSTLAKDEGLDQSATELLKISALLHDIGFSFGSAGHEEKGAELSGNILQRLGFETSAIETVQNNILATHGERQDGAYVTSPVTIQQKILCDADMSIAGQSADLFFQTGDLLRQEIGFEDIEEWNKGQLLFIQGIKWHTESAKNLWDEQRINTTRLLETINKV